MTLLLIDLDNTLVDRSSAFLRWARRLVESLGRPEAEVQWLVSADADGYRAREDLASQVARRFGLSAGRQEALVAELRAGLVEEMTLDPEVSLSLDAARAAGWIPFAVTNGTVAQQERKIRHLGLHAHLDGWLISEAAGCKKPDARIFERAAQDAGRGLTGAWMVGDHPDADIGGAHALGLSTAWIRRARTWSEVAYRPTLEVDRCADAIRAVVSEEP